MSEICKGRELEFSALGDFGGHPFSGSVLVSRVVLCVIALRAVPFTVTVDVSTSDLSVHTQLLQQ